MRGAEQERSYWREADARRVLKSLARTGESAAAFERRTGVPASRLLWWRKRLLGDDSKSTALRLLPVRVASSGEEMRASEPAMTSFEVVVGAYVVRVPVRFDDEAFVRLVQALDRTRC